MSLSEVKKPEALKPELTEVQKLRVRILELQFDLAQTNADLRARENEINGMILTAQKASLESELRKQLSAGEDEILDWEKLEFKKKEVPDKKD